MKQDMSPGGAAIAPLIDQTILKPGATRQEVAKLCAEARLYGFATACVTPSMVEFAAAELSGCAVKPCTVIGFPCGTSTTLTKSFEAEDALRNGAQELDMVLHIAALKQEDHRYVHDDIHSVVDASAGHIVKVILETCLLSDPEKETACLLVVDAGASFVKTSTGFADGGATTDDIQLMRRVVGPEFGVKASGGIRSRTDAQAMLDAGANRIGTSAGVAIVTG